MPLKIVPAREGSEAPRIRGSYRGVEVYRTVKVGRGATEREKRAAARALKKQLEDEIERGELRREKGATFLDAALDYVMAGGDATFLDRIKDHLGAKLLTEIDQAAVDACAVALYPSAAPATRNRQVYTPISAVMHHALKERAPRFRRPKGSRGRRRVTWLEPDRIFKLIAAASAYRKLRQLVVYLAYTGGRIGEALPLEWHPDAAFRVVLDEAMAWVPDTKTGEPRGVHLPPFVVTELRSIRQDEGSVFGYENRWQVYRDLDRALEDAGIVLPPRVKAHILRHSWATWMRRLGLSTDDLVDTGVWKDPRSASVYAHVKPGEMARRADDLPTPPPVAPVQKKESA